MGILTGKRSSVLQTVLFFAPLFVYCYGAPNRQHNSTGDGQCMREWLKMAGVPTSSLTALEEKARYYHLSESKIRHEHEAILKALLPESVVEKLKICTGNPSVCGRPAPCHAGQCVYNETINSHVCECPSGLLGDQCQTDIDECLSGQHDCDIAERAVCNNTQGSYLCHCRHGYCGEDGKHCDDVDECKKGTHGCHANATCTNVVGSYSCSCVDGFSGDGVRCDEILCTEKNGKSRLCQQVESMREQLAVIPRLEKKLEEQQKLLSSTTDNIISLSRALRSPPVNDRQRCHGIAAWRYYPWVNWMDPNDRDDRELRKVTYNKQRNDTILRVAFHSTLSQYNNRGCSEWFIRFSGAECTQPAPISTSVYTDHSNGADAWTSIPSELSGFCNATSSASISTGPVVISVHVRGCPRGNAHTGSPSSNGRLTSSLVVEEYCL